MFTSKKDINWHRIFSVRRRFVVAMLFGVFMTSTFGAGAGNTSVATLVESALANNPELIACMAEVEEARGVRRQAGIFKNPELSVEFGAREVRDSQNVLQGNGTTVSVMLTQPFEFPGKGTLRKAIAAKNIEIAELGLSQFRLSLSGKIRLLAYEYLAASAEAAAAESAYQRTAEISKRLATNQHLAGRALIEVRLMQAGLMELSSSIREALLRKAETRAEINALTGRPQDSPLVIAENLRPPKLRTDESALYFAAQNYNPLLLIRIKELERAQRELTATRLDIAPDFAIGPFFSRDVAGDIEQNIGGAISATLPLWDWNPGNIQSAKARAEAAEALRFKALREAEAEISSRLTAYQLAMKQIATAPPNFSEELAKTAALAETQFLNGAIGAQLFMESQSACLQALKFSNEALLDAWKSYLDLELLTGGHAAGSTGGKR